MRICSILYDKFICQTFLFIDHSILISFRKSQVDCESHDPSFDSFSINCEEEINALENDSHEYHGVCAHVLERKLHELLEMRQQEKIEELESALECAEKRLREKEIELELWKETHWIALHNKEEVFI